MWNDVKYDTASDVSLVVKRADIIHIVCLKKKNCEYFMQVKKNFSSLFTESLKFI